MEASHIDSNITLFIIIGTVCFFVLSISIILLILIQQQKEIKNKLRLEELKVEHQKKLTEMSFHGQENERKRIAHDLHDEIGSLLSAAKQQLNYINIKFKDLPELKSAIEETKGTLTDTIQEVRNIIENLSPVILESKGFAGAIQFLLEKLNHSQNFNTSFKQQGNAIKLDEKVQIMLYRIIQELINNTIKHAGASKLDLLMNWHEKQLLISITDNGKGFDFDEKIQSDHTGIGLKNILTRIEIIKGKVNFMSSKSGTKILINIPLNLN